MTAIDWESRPEPWRSIGLEWAMICQRICGPRVAVTRSELPDQVGIALFGRRKALKLTVQQLSDRCGLAASTITHLELGSASVSAASWAAIDAALAAAEAEAKGGKR